MSISFDPEALVDSPEHLADELDALANRAREVDVAEVSAITGIPHASCAAALFALCARGRCRCVADECGVLRFRFESPDPGGAPSWWRRAVRWMNLREMCAPLQVWAACVLLSVLAMIGVVLVGEIAETTAGSQSNLAGLMWMLGDLILSGVLLLVMPVVAVPVIVSLIAEVFIDLGRRMGFLSSIVYFFCLSTLLGIWLSSVVALGRSRVRSWPLVTEAQGFLFGGPRVGDPSDTRVLDPWLERRRWTVSAADVSIDTGLTLARAERVLAGLLVRRGGRAWATDEGAVVYQYPPRGPAQARSPRRGTLIDGSGTEDRCLNDEPRFCDARPAFVCTAFIVLFVGALTSVGGGWAAAVVLVLLVRVPRWRRSVRHARHRSRRRTVMRRARHEPEGSWVDPRHYDGRLVEEAGGIFDAQQTNGAGQVWLEFPTLRSGLLASRGARVAQGHVERAMERRPEPGSGSGSGG